MLVLMFKNYQMIKFLFFSFLGLVIILINLQILKLNLLSFIGSYPWRSLHGHLNGILCNGNRLLLALSFVLIASQNLIKLAFYLYLLIFLYKVKNHHYNYSIFFCHQIEILLNHKIIFIQRFWLINEWSKFYHILFHHIHWYKNNHFVNNYIINCKKVMSSHLLV
jgi:hypothetical protein